MGKIGGSQQILCGFGVIAREEGTIAILLADFETMEDTISGYSAGK